MSVQVRAYRSGMGEPVPNPYKDLSREKLLELLLVAREEVEDVAWTHRPSDDFLGATE